MKSYRLIFALTLGLVTFAAELYAMVSLEQGVFRFYTGLAQAIIFFTISWFFYGVGQKHSASTNELRTQRVVMSGVVTWGASAIAFGFMMKSFGHTYMAALVTLIVVALISYMYGRESRTTIIGAT